MMIKNILMIFIVIFLVASSNPVFAHFREFGGFGGFCNLFDRNPVVANTAIAATPSKIYFVGQGSSKLREKCFKHKNNNQKAYFQNWEKLNNPREKS